MIQSMTAFASAQGQFGSLMVSWELRSVNHRYQEISFRLPEAFRSLETPLRNCLREHCSRGKFECQLKLTEQGADIAALSINQPLINALLDAGATLASAKHLANDLSVTNLLNWPGVVQAAEYDQERTAQAILQVFEKALSQLCQTRRTEGQALSNHIVLRLTKMHEEVAKAKCCSGLSIDELRNRYFTKLQSLQLDVEQARIEQALALVMTRLDVSEELDRLETHLLETAKILDNNEAVGRRLDFLMQELIREANTLGSKSESLPLTQCVIEMKVLIEQMREQIQNIE